MSTSHVLVVDDEADIRVLIDEILSEEGYQVTVAGNAVEARAARSASKFDLVLLDIWMPDTDGISLLREWTLAEVRQHGSILRLHELSDKLKATWCHDIPLHPHWLAKEGSANRSIYSMPYDKV